MRQLDSDLEDAYAVLEHKNLLRPAHALRTIDMLPIGSLLRLLAVGRDIPPVHSLLCNGSLGSVC